MAEMKKDQTKMSANVSSGGGQIFSNGMETVITNETPGSSSGSTTVAREGEQNNTIFVGIGQVPAKLDYQTIMTTCDILKTHHDIEFSRNDLLKLMCYLEGELQAREVVIAALKSEKLKRFLKASRSKPLPTNDAKSALFRDTMANAGNLMSISTSSMVAQSEIDSRVNDDYHLQMLENVISEQRVVQMRMLNLMRTAEDKHKRIQLELEDEKRKHERDTAQGDDIAYGLEIERTKLKQELESERNLRKKVDKDMKKVQETLDQERARQKQIVLLLLAERKKIIMKYVEERKRSEDLAQILSEEKIRVDTMAEGLEEESKKSLRMEAEVEKQIHSFEIERKSLKNSISKEEKRVKDLEMELLQLRGENEALKKAGAAQASAPQIPLKPVVPRQDGMDDTLVSSPMMSSVAKVVQPTATVSSVPVSGPTTGIARSIAPGHMIKQSHSPINVARSFESTKQVPIRKLSNSSIHPPLTQSVAAAIPQVVSAPTATVSTSLHNNASKNVVIPIQSQQSIGGISTIKKAAMAPLGRGVPPPIPPNRPVIPPKRELSATRLSSFSSVTTNSKEKEHSNIAATASSGDAASLDEELQDFNQVLCSMTNK